MSLSAVHGTLSSLKSCQADIGTGMDIVTDVAVDLAEAQGKYYSVCWAPSQALLVSSPSLCFIICV